MIDIHSHIIPGVDDGAHNTEEAEEMLVSAARAGVTRIIATPHFNIDKFDHESVFEKYNRLKMKARLYNIELLLGYEIKIHEYPSRMPSSYSELVLGSSKYVLLELPFTCVPRYTAELIYQIQINKLIPIIAHSERCIKLVKDPQLLDELIGNGCLMQVDAASIVGLNSRKIKRFAKKLITSDKVDFVASDAHNAKDYSDTYMKAYQKTIKWVGQTEADKLFTESPKDVASSISKTSEHLL
jgi:protein-tyrosine phosphatase